MDDQRFAEIKSRLKSLDPDVVDNGLDFITEANKLGKFPSDFASCHQIALDALVKVSGLSAGELREWHEEDMRRAEAEAELLDDDESDDWDDDWDWDDLEDDDL